MFANVCIQGLESGLVATFERSGMEEMTSEVTRAGSRRVSKSSWRNRLFLSISEQLRALAGRVAVRYWEKTWVFRWKVVAGSWREE